MSGDLKNPSESIPKGTLQATAFTFVVYVLLFTLTAGTTSRDLLQVRVCTVHLFKLVYLYPRCAQYVGGLNATVCPDSGGRNCDVQFAPTLLLAPSMPTSPVVWQATCCCSPTVAVDLTLPLHQNNFGYLQDINTVPPLVLMGIFAATLSAALSTMIGASRILQAISRDQLLGEWSAYFSKEKTEPIRAVLLSWLLVQLVLLIGQINIIAPIVSMLFLLSYAITNFACFVLKVTGAPNFRSVCPKSTFLNLQPF